MKAPSQARDRTQMSDRKQGAGLVWCHRQAVLVDNQEDTPLNRHLGTLPRCGLAFKVFVFLCKEHLATRRRQCSIRMYCSFFQMDCMAGAIKSPHGQSGMTA